MDGENGGLPMETGFASNVEMAFWELVRQLVNPEADPALIVGALKDKVDSIEFIDSSLKQVAELMKARAKPFLEKARSATNNRERLREYVAGEMAKHQYEKLPGNVYNVVLMDSPPSLEMKREPDAYDYERWPQYVHMERVYSWKKDAIKDEMLSGKILDLDFPGIITRGHYPKFQLRIPEQLDRKKKGKS